MSTPTVRYSFANAKQVHIDLYKALIVDAVNNSSNKGISAYTLCEAALYVADAAVEALSDGGRIGHAD